MDFVKRVRASMSASGAGTTGSSPTVGATASPSRPMSMGLFSTARASLNVKSAGATALSIGGGLLQSERDTLQELGLGDDQPLCLLADSIFARFQDLADVNTGRVDLDEFVKDVLSRGIVAKWGDAAFRAFESPPFSGSLTKFAYCLAIISLLSQETELTKRPAWMELRRKVIFAYYDAYQQGALDVAQFSAYLEDASTSDHPLAAFGIHILTPEHLSDRESHCFSPGSTNSTAEIAASLALSRVQLAETRSELQQQQLSFLQLEKKFCALKLELAEERARKDPG